MFKTSDFASLCPFCVLEFLMLQLQRTGGGGICLSGPPKQILLIKCEGCFQPGVPSFWSPVSSPCVPVFSPSHSFESLLLSPVLHGQAAHFPKSFGSRGLMYISFVLAAKQGLFLCTHIFLKL